LGKREAGVCPPQKTSKFGPNNCLANNFVHYKFTTFHVEQFKNFTLGGR